MDLDAAAPYFILLFFFCDIHNSIGGYQIFVFIFFITTI